MARNICDVMLSFEEVHNLFFEHSVGFMKVWEWWFISEECHFGIVYENKKLETEKLKMKANKKEEDTHGSTTGLTFVDLFEYEGLDIRRVFGLYKKRKLCICGPCLYVGLRKRVEMWYCKKGIRIDIFQD